MCQPICRISALSLLVLLLAGCGATMQPRLRTGDTAPRPGFPPEDHVGPRPAPKLGGAPDARPTIDQICRTQPMPSGWIAIRYMEGGDKCPSRDRENPYTVAVIERFSDKPIGAIMVVCADRPMPHGWVREWNDEVSAECPGARVRSGQPTVYVMQRIR
jgi:hypothetical protein